MRNTCLSLLILAGTSAFAANHQPRVESPIEWDASLLTSAYACTQGINRAQVVTNAGDAAFKWSVLNGLVVNGDATPAMEYSVVAGGDILVSVSVKWQGVTLVRSALLPVLDPPSILRQPQSITVAPGASVTLTVVSSDDMAIYDWFEGPAGDTSKIVSAGAAAFKTPALAKSTQYWVRVTGRCGVVESKTATVTLLGRRRSAGR